MQRAQHNPRGYSFVFLFIVLFFTILVVLGHEIKQRNTDNYIHITIKQGDTLWSLANTYSQQEYKDKQDFIDWVEKANSVNPTHLVPGQHLVLPIYHKMKGL